MTNWYEIPENVIRAKITYGTAKDAARELGGGERAVQRAFKREGVNLTRQEAYASSAQSSDLGQIADAGSQISDTNATIVTSKSQIGDIALDPDDVLRDNGLDPKDWVVTDSWPNSWNALAPEGEVVTLHQLKLQARKIIPDDMILPARNEGYRPRRITNPKRSKQPELVLTVGDTHAPYHDKGLHECTRRWLAHNKPQRAYDLGDLVDLPIPSRHRPTQGFEATPQECIDTRYEVDVDRVDASEDTVWEALYGNHDIRVDHAVRDKIGAHVARLSRAGSDLPVLDLAYLLRYDELGIKIHRPPGDYHSVTIEIAPGLFARHGTKAGKHGGAMKAVERRDSSLASARRS